MITAEQLAYWFFRLNGCFTITNFVVHPDKTRARERFQRTEADIIAVRFPHRCELATSTDPMQDHKIFTSYKTIDLIFAEVKKGLCRLNDSLIKSEKGNIERLLNATGIFPPDEVTQIAGEIYNNYQFFCSEIRVRLFAIGKQINVDILPEVQLTWEDVLKFMYDRFKGNSHYKVDHSQWDQQGTYLYNQAIGSSEEKFKRIILQEMNTS